MIRQTLHRVTIMFTKSLVLVLAICCTLCDAGRSDETIKIDFNRDIQPILANHCFACHGPDTSGREAGLRLDLREAALGHHQDGVRAIVPGKPDESELIRRIESSDPFEVMPQDPEKRLSREQIALLREWVRQGAEFRDHWAFERPIKADLPSVQNADWHRNEIDYFVLADLEEKGIQPNPVADRTALIRRVTLDLTGMLPTIEEVDAFLADRSDNAYEKVVDRLLKSSRYGEHRARYWMDYARYGDTQGLHVDAYQSRWPYRDYVIRAFNCDMPYDQFTREQLAGDLLPPKNIHQLVATGFIRCGIATGEAGTIIEELKVNLARERAETFGSVFLGLTTGCAACHDHKYDPLTQHDFYALTAFFNNITEKASCDDREDWPPSIRVPKETNLVAYDAVLAEKAGVLRQLAARRAQADKLIASWLNCGNSPQAVTADRLELRLRLDENHVESSENSTVVHNTAPDARSTTFTTEGPKPHWGEETHLWPTFRFETNTRLNLGSAGDFEKDEPFSCGGWIKVRNVPGGRSWNTKQGALIARMDAANKLRGWNLYYTDGALNVQLVHAWPDAISVKTVGTTEYRGPFAPIEGSHGGTNTTETLPRGGWSHVFFTYDGTGQAGGIKIFVNGIEQKVDVEHDRLSGSIRTEAPTWLGRRHDTEPMQATAYQDIRFYRRQLSPDEVVRVQREDIAAEIVASTKRADWSRDQRKIVEDVFLTRFDQPSADLRSQLPKLDADLVRLAAGGPVTLICREKSGLPYADILHRGAFAARKKRVSADVPHFLPPLPDGALQNRLGLANWVVSPENPLTARVTVNRIWQEVFGTGLVETSEDVGMVGARPSHPELLDWLAVDFRENDWRVKRLYKMLVMSATYRQSTHATPKAVARDPNNRRLARGPRFRMDGEMLRDIALQTSGLLVEKIGGPSVKPYQPAGVWDGSYGNQKYTQQHGENLYRRSLYTFWKRMAPMPNMEAFDATDRSAVCVRRQRTNTPMAALVMMNDPQFLEAAPQLGSRALRFGGDTDENRIDFLGQVLLSRRFDDQRRKALSAALKEFRVAFAGQEDKAKVLLSIGESAVIDSPSLTTNKPVTASTFIAGTPPQLANDGARNNTDKYWSMDAARGTPAWWQVDLVEPTDVGCVVVVGYYGNDRHYGFLVETSLDGNNWDIASDWRDNKHPATREGYVCEFEPRKTRFLRVTQTHNSANSGRHLVEVMAFHRTPPAESAVSAIEQAVWMMMATTIMNTDAVMNK